MTPEEKFCQLDWQPLLFYTLIKEMHVKYSQLISCPAEVLVTTWVLHVNLMSFAIYATAGNAH